MDMWNELLEEMLYLVDDSKSDDSYAFSDDTSISQEVSLLLSYVKNLLVSLSELVY